MFYSGHSRQPKPADYDSLPYRQDSADYTVGQDYRCKARPGWMFTYRGMDGDDPDRVPRSWMGTTNGVRPLDNWDVRSWPVESL